MEEEHREKGESGEKAKSEETKQEGEMIMSEEKKGSQDALGILKGIPTPVMAINKVMEVTYMNDAGAAALKRPMDSIIGKKCYHLFDTPHCNTAECRVKQAMERDGVFTGETVARGAGNLPVQYTGSPLKNSAGEIIGGIEYIVDITETKKAMDNAQLKVDYLNRIPTPVMVINKNMEVQFMNESGAQALKSSPDALIGKKCFNLFDTLHCNTPECRTRQAMEKDGIFTGETVARGVGNLPIQYTGAPIKDNEGRIVGGIEYVADITETKKAMDDAAEKVDYLNNVPTPVMVINKNMEVVFMNKAGANALNTTAEALKGKKCATLFDTPHCNTPECRMRQAMEKDGIFTGETVARGVGNLPIQYTCAPLKDKEGKIIGGLEYVADITDIKKAQAIAQEISDFQTTEIEKISANLGLLAEGDLSFRADTEKGNENTSEVREKFQALCEALNKGLDGLNNAFAQIAGSVNQVASSAQQLSATSEEMASGAEEQTSQTSQVATSVEEMSATVQEVAKNANQAAGDARGAGDVAKKGGDIVSQTIEGMGHISESVQDLQKVIAGLSQNSEKIGDIVGVIDDVADQTNLLALNAAIEAARAGEQGRGFAVVADEVRKLAERTTSSTKEIAQMVKSIQGDTSKAVGSMEKAVGEVGSGVNLAQTAGTSLSEIVQGSQKVQDLVQQIATAAEEQSAAAEEISSNVESIASVSKQTASGAQQTSAAAQEMSNLSGDLQGMIQKFRLREGIKIKEADKKEHARQDFGQNIDKKTQAVDKNKKWKK